MDKVTLSLMGQVMATLQRATTKQMIGCKFAAKPLTHEELLNAFIKVAQATRKEQVKF